VARKPDIQVQLPPSHRACTDNRGWLAKGLAANRRKHMAKGQQNQKMVKKPKKDTSPPKTVSPDAVRPTVVTVVPVRGKLKNK
jgi:hypothetical protein